MDRRKRRREETEERHSIFGYGSVATRFYHAGFKLGPLSSGSGLTQAVLNVEVAVLGLGCVTTH